MARYTVITLDDRRYIPIRYDNFAALGAAVQPAVPWVLVPLFSSISDALKEARSLQAEFDGALAAVGVGRTGVAAAAPDYQQKLNFPFRFFRGERSLRFNIMPTRYRFSGELDLLATTRERMRFETECAEGMRKYLQRHGMPQASLEQARAAARHYGAPSSFVDFSFSPDVAAFFAHPAFGASERERGADVGILYSLGIQDFERLFGMAAWSLPPDGGRDIHYLNVANVWRIPYRSFDPATRAVEDAVLVVPVPARLVARPISIRTRIVPAIRRIAAQDGIFLDVGFEDPEDWWAQVFLWTVLDFASRKWCFFRQDFGYESSETGATAAKLFPPDDPELAELTRGFSACA